MDQQSDIETGNLPSWIGHLMTTQDRIKVEQTITDVEKTTDGEIVVAIARRSAAVSLVPVVLFLFGCAIIMDLHHRLAFSVWLDAVLVGVAACLAWWLGRQPGIQRALLSVRESNRQVGQAAATEFLAARINHTQAATGVLIHVSLMEHRVSVIGDAAISAKLSQTDWDEMVGVIVRGIKRGNFSDGLQRAIMLAGALLAKNFPKSPGNTSELHNTIRFIE